ncbi:MAG: hypothetical protein GY950_26790 [bacterium]|nr:hypothetical protein [bacterium]
MEIVSRQTILRYLQITLLSYSRICYFVSIKDPKTRVKVRFLHVSGKAIQMRLSGIPKGVEGNLVFYSYTFIFRSRVKLQAASEEEVYYCEIPAMIETFVRRKYARLKFESRENKVVTIYNKTLNKSSQGILSDISAGGLGFTMVDVRQVPKVGDTIMMEVQLKEKKFQSLAEVVQVRNDHVGCTLLEKSVKFQLELNAVVKREVDWRSEAMLQNLKKREEMMRSFKKAQEEISKSKDRFNEKLDNLDPLIDYFNKGFEAAAGMVLSKEKAEHRDSTALDSLSYLSFNFFFHHDLLFKGYFFTQDEVLYKVAPSLFDNNLGGRGINSSMVLNQLGKKLLEYSGRLGESKEIFTMTGAEVNQVDKRLLSQLLRQPSIRVQFDSGAGKFVLVLLAENLEDSLNLCYKAREREFLTMEKMDLIEPISYSTLRVFSEYLKLEIREKSVTTRDQLLPRFEISVLLDIFFDDFEGKVVLNLSKRLALKIYEILLDEPAEEFNREVKDAVAEITNMITGNAKSEFEKHGIYYKLGTPLVVESRKGVIIYATNMKFLSSVYWTSEGFFDLNFSIFKK